MENKKKSLLSQMAPYLKGYKALFGLAVADPFAWICACIFLLTGSWLYIYSKNAKQRLEIY